MCGCGVIVAALVLGTNGEIREGSSPFTRTKIMKTVTKNCLFCKKEFEASLKEVNRGYGKFCSIVCSNDNKRLKPKKPDNVNCSNCGKSCRKTQSDIQAAKTGMLFCSRECKDESQLKGLLPVGHYWTSRQYRKLAFREKPQKCEICGYNKYPEILEVHHKDQNRYNNQITNLEILCPTCHSEQHFILRNKEQSGPVA